MSVLSTLFFGVLGLGMIVLVHEAGHFLAAKAVGIEVEVFSIGWGRRLVGFRRGSTRYQIALFPIGGYCKMKGEMPRGDMSEERMQALRGEPGAFLAAPPWRRIVVAAAGPTGNFLFALAALTLIWWIGFPVHSTPSKVILASEYEPAHAEYAADRAGLATGDVITAIDGHPIRSFWELSETVRRSAGRPLQLTVERQGRTHELSIVPQRDPQTGFGKIGVYAWIDPVVGSVRPGSPAERAGLLPGDVLVALETTPIQHELGFYAALQALLSSPGAAVTVRYTRGGVPGEALLSLESDGGVPDLGLGFAQQVYRSPRLTLLEAAATGLQRVGEIAGMSLAGLRQLLRLREHSLDEVVAGPIRITSMMGEAATGGFRLGLGEGLVSFFQFAALLSIAIAVMNLLPLPALDGGLIVISAGEALARRPLSPKVLRRLQAIGAVVIFGLIFLAVASDILFYVG